MCSQSIDTIVDVGILLELSGVVFDANAACSHLDDGCTAVQAGNVNTRRRLSLAVLVCDNHVQWQSRAGSGPSHGCVDGSVLASKLAEFEQVAAAWRAKSSRENLLQPGAKRDIASGQIA